MHYSDFFLQVLLDITRPYTKVSFDFLVTELLMSQDEVETLLIEMILDNRLNATIDQVNGCILLNKVSSSLPDIEMEKISRLADLLTSASASLCVNI